MQDIVELERRITAAMQRITHGVERLAAQKAGGDQVDPTQGHDDQADEIARLSDALDEERMTNAQLNERLRVLHDKLDSGAPSVSDAIAADPGPLHAQMAEQADEIATLRRVLAEAGKEIASLRAARALEAVELGEIVGALDPLIRTAQMETPHA